MSEVEKRMFEMDVAWRHVNSNRRGTAFTLISVTIAVAIIIMSLGLTEGVRMQIVENTVEKNPTSSSSPSRTRTTSSCTAASPTCWARSPAW